MNVVAILKAITARFRALLVVVGIVWLFGLPSSASGSERIHEAGQKPTERKGMARNSTLKPDDVKTLVDRVFGGLFDIDERITPNHVLADFNGDDVQDVAIAVRLHKDVDYSNEAKPMFHLYKPVHTGLNPDRYKEKDRLGILGFGPYSKRAHMAIVHGIAHRSWSDAHPEQAHLLLDFPGIAPNRLRSYHGRLRAASAGDEPRPTRPPRLVGYAILAEEVFEQGVGAVAYWDGLRYRQYPFNTSRKR